MQQRESPRVVEAPSPEAARAAEARGRRRPPRPLPCPLQLVVKLGSPRPLNDVATEQMIHMLDQMS